MLESLSSRWPLAAAPVQSPWVQASRVEEPLDRVNLRLHVPAEEPPDAAPSSVAQGARIGLAALGALVAAGMATPAMAAADSPVTATVAVSSATRTAAAAPTRAVRVPNLSRFEVNREIERLSAKYDVPADILKAIVWQESGWTHAHNGVVVYNVNRDQKSGAVRSTDWGIVQLNDAAHPRAFPRARTDPKFSLDFAAKLLHSLNEENGGDWNRTIARYNGINNPGYLRAIQKHREIQPWKYYVARDELGIRRGELRRVDARQKGAVTAAAEKDRLVSQAEKRVEELGGGTAPLTLPESQRKTLEQAEKRLAAAREAAVKAHATVDGLTAQKHDLEAKIAQLDQEVAAEKARLTELKRQGVLKAI